MNYLDKALQIQKEYKENKNKFETTGKIDGTRGREDGYKTEDLVRELLGWEQNNLDYCKAIDAYSDFHGYVDIKSGAAKQYGGTFKLEIVQRAQTGLDTGNKIDAFSDWTWNSAINYLAYIDWSDDRFPLYFYPVEELRKIYQVETIVNNTEDKHLRYWSKEWRHMRELQVPRECDASGKKMECFGKSALGFDLPTNIASDIFYLREIMEEKDAESRDKSSDGNNRTNKRKTSNSLSDNKK